MQFWKNISGILGPNYFFLKGLQWIKRRKCSFGKILVGYFTLFLFEGDAMDQEKIKSVIQWPIPKSIKEGLNGYYRKLVKDYGKIARPLTNLLKKGGFLWIENQKTTNALGCGIGAVLIQEARPISYFSKALSAQTLLGRKFVVYTDQKSLRHLLKQRVTTQNQQDWIAKLFGYQLILFISPRKKTKLLMLYLGWWRIGNISHLESRSFYFGPNNNILLLTSPCHQIPSKKQTITRGGYPICDY
ncbi:putative mitochondrial protein, partial [Mucuna pruriens]